MKLKKTYRDFVNEVITEKVGENSIGKTTTGHQETMKRIKEYFNRENRRQPRQILRTWAEAFVQTNPALWRTQIRNIRRYIRTGGTPPPSPTTMSVTRVTPFQVMIYFFLTYLQDRHGQWRNINEIRQQLEEASETIQMDEDYYSNSTIREMLRLIRQGQRNRQLFVHVFNSLR